MTKKGWKNKRYSIGPTVGDVLDAFKSITTHRYINGVKLGLVPPFTKRFWQRNYWEHIVRNEQELDAIRFDIRQNSISWETDKLNAIDDNSVREDCVTYGEEIWMH